MVGVERLTVKVPVYICGFGIQVGVDQAFFEGDEDVQEWSFLIVGVYCEFVRYVEVVEVLRKLFYTQIESQGEGCY